MTLEQFEVLIEKNPRIKKDDSSVLAKRLGVSEETIKEFRKRIKEKKKQLDLDVLNTPSLEQLDAVNFRVDSKPQAPASASGYVVSSFKTSKDGTIAEVWQKLDESNESFVSEIDWDNLAKIISNRTKPVKLISRNNKGLMSKIVCISDIHCGMLTENWGKDQMFKAFEKVGNSISNCDNVTILMLGDGIDGLSKQTVRGGHKLPQDMNNQEQILNLTTAFQTLFDILATKVNNGEINSFDFESVYESNHSGDMDYVVGKFLEMWLSVKYPSVDCNISTNIWGAFNLNGVDFYYTHGKDAENSKFGLPMNLNEKTELYLTHILKRNFGEFDLDPRKNVVVSGDLHTQSFSQGKFFKYYKVPAMSPSSDWVKANFGYSIPGVQYFNVYEDSSFETGIIEL